MKHITRTIRSKGDAAREIDLQTALSACSENGLTIRRVDATLDADALHTRIREIVCEIRQKGRRKRRTALSMA